MSSKLGIYNGALLHLEERKLASLSENREPRRALDDAWDVVAQYCLEKGYWKFAMRSVGIDASPSVEPAFGFQYAFPKPDDWLRTYQIADNERFEPLLNAYTDEGSYWFADQDSLYFRYVSGGTDYGMDLSRWPAVFAEWVSIRLAVRTCKRITGNDSALDRLRPQEKKAFAECKSFDAMNGPPQFAPTGTWVQSRWGGWGNRSRWNGSTI